VRRYTVISGHGHFQVHSSPMPMIRVDIAMWESNARTSL